LLILRIKNIKKVREWVEIRLMDLEVLQLIILFKVLAAHVWSIQKKEGDAGKRKRTCKKKLYPNSK
jgi:hypothetical protein